MLLNKLDKPCVFFGFVSVVNSEVVENIFYFLSQLLQNNIKIYVNEFYGFGYNWIVNGTLAKKCFVFIVKKIKVYLLFKMV